MTASKSLSSLPDWRELSLAQQVAQMLVVRASGFLFDHQIRYPQWEPPQTTLKHWVSDLGVGGIIFLGGSAAELAARSHQLQSWSACPLLLAADIEEGVGQRFSGATWFPPPMAIGAVAQHDRETALRYAEEMGAITAREARAIGLNWVLAPVVDVNNNPLNPVINVRSFGDTPDGVSQLAIAFIRGAHRYPVLTSAKHFPGHGDTAVDSHLDLPVIPHAWERLSTIELSPFKAAIAAGVDAVMSAHLRIPALDETYPATLSPAILTGLLRDQMAFDGLIVTDALVMGAIAHNYGVNEAPVLAVEAGADILLMPLDPEGAIQAVCAAVETGRISPDRIHASVERIWRAKAKILQESAHGSDLPDAGLDQLAQPQARQTVARVLADSMQTHVPQRLVPVPSGRNVVVVDDLMEREFLGHHTPAIARPQAQGYDHLLLVDRYTPCRPASDLLQEPLPTLLQLFVRGNPFRGSAGPTQMAYAWLAALLEAQQLQGLVIYGSPYVVTSLCAQLPSDLPWVFTYGQLPDAQAVALDALFSPDRVTPESPA